jgi:hypothetical protein
LGWGATLKRGEMTPTPYFLYDVSIFLVFTKERYINNVTEREGSEVVYRNEGRTAYRGEIRRI